jgi:hypothetical protein
MRRHLLCLIVGVAVLSGCAVGGDEPVDHPRRDLAGRPSALPGDLPPPPAASATPLPAGSAAPSPGTTSPGSVGQPSGGSTGGPVGSSSPGAPSAPFHEVVADSDFRGDADPSAPGYADLIGITIEDNGAQARVTLTVNGTLPAKTAAEEVMGVGIDLYRQGNTGRESDYQLFADGEPTGWYAYLQTPKGFVRYPGTFALGGGRVVFTVPWSAIGSPRSGRYAAFVDWTRKTGALTGNDGSNDYAPLVGTAPYSR